MERSWPLTGRVEELRFIDAAIRRSRGPRGVVLAGAAGVGKTRLAREALASAEQRGVATRWATGTASTRALPLGAFAALLGTVGGDPVRVLPQATDALLAGTGRAGVVVGVDDAHLLDELSAFLVHQLVLRGAARVVVTVRTAEPAPDAVTALWKDGHLDRLEVQPLSEAEIAVLLEAVLGGPVDSRGAARMWALTCGNALYLRQLVDGEVESGRLSEVGGVWRWSGEPEVSPGLAELVDARMGQLSERVRDVVDVLALGEPLGVALLAQLTDPAAVEDAEGCGLVRAESGMGGSFRRDLPIRSTARSAGPASGSCGPAGCVALFWTLRQPAEAEAVLDGAAAATTDEGSRRVLSAMRAACHAFLGRPHQAVQSGIEALTSEALPDQAVVLATYGLVGGLGVLGRADQVGSAASRGYAAGARSFDAAVLRLGLGDLHVLALRLGGYLHEAERIALDRRDESPDTPGPQELYGVSLLGHAALARGQLRTSIRWLREARAGLAKFETLGFEVRCAICSIFDPHRRVRSPTTRCRAGPCRRIPPRHPRHCPNRRQGPLRGTGRHAASQSR